MDCQIEVANLILVNLLSCLVGEKSGNWDLVLPTTKFAYNISINMCTGHSPFEVIPCFSSIRPLDLVLMRSDIHPLSLLKVLLITFVNCMMRLNEKLF